MSLYLKTNLGVSCRVSRAWYRRAALKLKGLSPSRMDDFLNNRYFNTTNGPSPFPFSSVRTTPATSFDSQGRLGWNPQNQLTRSGVATAAVGAPGTAPTGWTMTLGLSNGVTRSIVNKGFAGGIEYIDVAFTGTFTTAENITFAAAPGITTIAAQPGQRWCGSFYWALVSGVLPAPVVAIANGIRLRWGNPGVLAANTNANFIPTTLTRVSVIGTAPAATTVVGCDFLYSFAAGRTVNFVLRIGAFQLEQADANSPKPYIETTGTAYFGPRLDYNPADLTPHGLLIEEAATNFVVGNTVLIPNAGNVSAGSSYLGGWPSTRLTGDGTNAIHTAASSNITPTAGQPRRVSATMRMISGTRIQLTVSANHAPITAYVNVNMTNGTVVGSGAGASNITVDDLGAGVYRVGFNYTTNNTVAGPAGITSFITADGDTRLPTNTSSSIVDILFFENCTGSNWHSIIPTYSTVFTAGADVCTTPTGSWLTQGLGTLLVSFTVPAHTTGQSPVIMQLDDGTTNNFVRSFFTTFADNYQVGTRLDTAAVTQVNTTIPTNTNYFTPVKFACSYVSNNARLVTAGGAIAVDNTCTVPTGLTTFRIGNTNGSPAPAMWLREARYYGTGTATDAELQALTR